ncbi:MAG: 5-formyltetrahydrofolate cyclo-ligase [Muribaculaceae bacterium]
MNKEDIRYQIRCRKSLMTDAERQSASQKVLALLERTEAFMQSSKILMYYSLADEIDTHLFLDKWDKRKELYLPRVNGENLEILQYNKSSLQTGAFKIEEPIGTQLYNICDIDLIIVPAVALDRVGNRIGRGKGFYDRLLTGSKATKIGVIYDFQLVDYIAREAHDVALDYVITENEIIKPDK